MLNSRFIAAIGGALALAMTAIPPAIARDQPDARPAASETSRALENGQSTGRTANRRQPARQAAGPTTEEIIAAAQTTATAAGLACQVTEATALGVTAAEEAVYEAACATGPGYILVASTPPQTIDCVLLAGQAATQRARDPAADVGQQCVLPTNLDVNAVIAGYARQAGIVCTVDDARAIGRTAAGNLLYEVGCLDEDGYWLEQTDTGWNTTACWEIVNGSETCRFSTLVESNSAWKSVLAGTAAAACDVQQTRVMGVDADGLKIHELKCVSGDGYLARVGADRIARRVHPCAEATHIGGGCQLGVAPAVTVEDTPTTPAL